MAPATAAANKAPVQDDLDVSDFLSAEEMAEISQDVESRYISPSKLPAGKSVFRFLGAGISGYEYWETDGEKNSPVRSRTKPAPEDMSPNAKVDEETGKLLSPKRFIAGIVWDYQSESFRLLHFDQKGLISKFLENCANKRFGQATRYDIEISKEGSGMTTKYNLVAYPPEPVAPEILEAYGQLRLAPLSEYLDNNEIFL